MVTLNEVFGSKGSRSFAVSTYTPQEGGNMDLSYQLDMTVNANVQSPAKQAKLVTYVKNDLGYQSCDIDPQNNTVRVYNLTGIDKEGLMRFIKKSIDKHASVRSTG